jgi:hypothetical protein
MAAGVVFFRGEQSHGFGGADAFEHFFQRMSCQIGQVGVLPAFLDAGECQLHGADVGNDLEAVSAKPIAQIPGHAVKQRVATGQHYRAAMKILLHQLHQLGRIVADRDGLAGQFRQQGQNVIRTQDDFRFFQQLPSMSGQSAPAIRAHTNDVNFIPLPTRLASSRVRPAHRQFLRDFCVIIQ